MFDIWDNRQLARLKAMILEFIKVMEKDKIKYDHALDSFKEITEMESFEDLYRLCKLQYMIDPEGDLSHFSDNSFNCIFSVDVLEHVPKASVSKVVNDIYRVLKPGGYSIHMIGLDDHLAHYDSKESPKKYLCYSDPIWRLFFENQVQYINRLQVSDWLTSFQKVNLQLQEKMTESCNIESLKIDKKYLNQAKEDLACTRLVVVHRKPVGADKNT
jgi:predicted SAM-dependent methyltransferase